MIQDVGDWEYYLRAIDSRLYLDIQSGDVFSGILLVTNNIRGISSQRWKISSLTAVVIFDVAGETVTPGTRIV